MKELSNKEMIEKCYQVKALIEQTDIGNDHEAGIKAFNIMNELIDNLHN